MLADRRSGPELTRRLGRLLALALLGAAVALPGAQGQPYAFPGQNGMIVHVARSSLIVVSTPEGSRRTVVATGDHPAWSPDGKRIAYDSYEGISVATARGVRVVADRVVIRNGRAVEAQQPAWAPDGQRLAYVQGPKSALDGRNVLVADLRSGTRRRITRSARGYDNLQPAWSPDGRWIAFAGCNPRGRCRIMIMRPDGSGRRALARLVCPSARLAAATPEALAGARRRIVHVSPGRLTL